MSQFMKKANASLVQPLMKIAIVLMRNNLCYFGLIGAH
jgi:hypothetical protein